MSLGDTAASYPMNDNDLKVLRYISEHPTYDTLKRQEDLDMSPSQLALIDVRLRVLKLVNIDGLGHCSLTDKGRQTLS